MLMWQPSRETGRTPCASRAMWCAAAAAAAANASAATAAAEAAVACAFYTVRYRS